MVRRTRAVLVSAITVALLAACTNQPNTPPAGTTPGAIAVTVIAPTVAPETGYPAPNAAATPGSYPAPNAAPASTTDPSYPPPATPQGRTTDGRGRTALKALPLAEEVAKQSFDQGAVLHAISPSRIVLKNIGGPPVVPGWFFKFKVPNTPREFLVQVVDNQVSGTSQAEPLVPLEPAELPLDISTITVDSDKVFEQFQAYAQQQNIPTEGISFDFELVNLAGSTGPTWSVIDPRDNRWLYSVNAATGEVVANPYNR